MRSRLVLCFVGLSVGVVACGGGGGGGQPPSGTPTIRVAGLPAGPLSPNTAYAIVAVEAIGVTAVAPGALTISLDNPAVGTISGTTLTAGLANATGNLTVRDASRSLSATVTLSVGSTHPASAGDTVNLAGSLVQTVTRPLPAPSAVPPPFTSQSTIAIATTTSTGAQFGPTGGLTDFKSVETDTSLSPAIATTTTTDSYEQVIANGSAFDVVTPGNSAIDSNGNTFTTTYNTGNGLLLDVLPETNGGTFSNAAALVYNEVDAGGATAVRTVQPSGAYAESDTFADTTTQAIVVNTDLSGRINSLRGQTTTFAAVAAPKLSTTGGGSVIDYSLTTAASTTPQIIKVPDWYPTTTLASDTVTTTTGQPIPASCSVPASVGTIATQLSERYARLDPMLGTYELRTTTTYLAPFVGVACVSISDRLDDYYDYSRQVAGFVVVANVPIQTTVTTETIGLSKTNIVGAPFTVATRASETARKSDSSSLATSSTVERSFAIARASFDRVISRLYAKRTTSVRDGLAHAQFLRGINR